MRIDEVVSTVNKYLEYLKTEKNLRDDVDCLLMTTNQYNSLKQELQSIYNDHPYNIFKSIGIDIYVADGLHYDSLRESLEERYEKIGIVC